MKRIKDFIMSFRGKLFIMLITFIITITIMTLCAIYFTIKYYSFIKVYCSFVIFLKFFLSLYGVGIFVCFVYVLSIFKSYAELFLHHNPFASIKEFFELLKSAMLFFLTINMGAGITPIMLAKHLLFIYECAI